MLTNVHIQNFKSVRDLKFGTKRVNLFIGEPNTGKTNILEALALFSDGVHVPEVFNEVFRFRSVAELFTDQQVSDPVKINTSRCLCFLSFSGQQFAFVTNAVGDGTNGPNYVSYLNGSGDFIEQSSPQDRDLHYGVKYYRFKSGAGVAEPEIGVLNPPFGTNLASILKTNKGLRSRVSDLFRSRNFRLEIRPVENELRIAKEMDGELFSFPYDSVSETWRRIVFYMAVLETNQNSTILLDEPEANTFPFYTAYLAERIALDETNQFFVTTHNPYILSSIVGKTPVKDLAVFVANMENFCTNVKLASVEGLSKILDYGPDAFLNLDKIVAA
jgi:predicted ATPase